MAWKLFSRSDRSNALPSATPKPSRRARRRDAQVRARRLVVEQLEERALLALTAFPTGQFGAPRDTRMSEGYWEALNLAELGRAAEIPGPVAPTSNSGVLGYTIDQ